MVDLSSVYVWGDLSDLGRELLRKAGVRYKIVQKEDLPHIPRILVQRYGHQTYRQAIKEIERYIPAASFYTEGSEQSEWNDAWMLYIDVAGPKQWEKLAGLGLCPFQYQMILARRSLLSETEAIVRRHYTFSDLRLTILLSTIDPLRDLRKDQLDEHANGCIHCNYNIVGGRSISDKYQPFISNRCPSLELVLEYALQRSTGNVLLDKQLATHCLYCVNCWLLARILLNAKALIESPS